MSNKMEKGEMYRFKYTAYDNLEPIKYIGYNFSGNGYWHQFTKDGEVWCELRDSDLDMIEKVEL